MMEWIEACTASLKKITDQTSRLSGAIFLFLICAKLKSTRMLLHLEMKQIQALFVIIGSSYSNDLTVLQSFIRQDNLKYKCTRKN